MKRQKELLLFIILIIILINLSCQEKTKADTNQFEKVKETETISISADAAGRISAVHVNNNDSVNKDDILISIDDSAIIARLMAIEDKRNSIERVAKNKRSEMQESELEIINQEIYHIEQQINNLLIISPCKGIVKDIFVKESEFVTIGKELIILETLNY
jgi:multidrug resistance efflux pump